jgi:hypothetical protein
MNTAPFRTKSSEPPKLRAFGSGNGASFAERAAAFKAPAVTTPTESVKESIIDKVVVAPIEASVSVSTMMRASETVAPSFSSAPKLSAAAAAAYVPKNARPATNTNTIVLTPDMFPALASKSSSVSKPAEVTAATIVDSSAPKKMSFADIMKKRVAQDAIEAEQLERERLRELARKEREERDLRSLRIQPRRTYYEEEHNEAEEGDYNDEYHEPAVRGYDAGNYGNHEVEDHYEEDHAPPMDEEEWND